MSDDRFMESRIALARALEIIPLGTQTFSKAHSAFPGSAAPHFIERARGGRLWDVDGAEYVDQMCALMPILLGYCDPDVDNAVKAQLERGMLFSLSSKLEMELAELLVRLVPSAEMVRFGKNGTDVTTAAVRLARAATGRDHILMAGYHGWGDWSIATTSRNWGIPKSVGALSHAFSYGSIDALASLFRDYPGNIAAVIVEPAPGNDAFLREAAEMVRAAGAILIFDEIVSGFRAHLGGVQALCGITPDLTTLGKAMGNGMPISALVGRADLMRLFEDVFFSGTFSGEALSLAAAIATISKLESEPVIETLARNGNRLKVEAERRINEHMLGDVISLDGLPQMRKVVFTGTADASAAAVKTVFQRGMIRNGVLITQFHGLCYAHNKTDIDVILTAYDKTLPVITEEIDKGNLDARLGDTIVRPVFDVRYEKERTGR